VHSYA